VNRSPVARIREVGDAALVLELGSSAGVGADLDIEVNRHATGIARAVSRLAIRGVRDVVPTFRSVAVSFDPLATDVATLAAALLQNCDDSADEDGPVHEVPVAYGGTDGPDLEAVASFGRCSPKEVIERHSSRTYRVFMLGFLPGFAYMGSVDDAIAAPRRATPRLRVPAGSVAIAGPQTGIYPLDSPGGWQIIGRTTVRPFTPHRVPSSLFAPGDRVRFVPVPTGFPQQDSGSRPLAASVDTVAPRYVTVVRPGLHTTVQDSGRWGSQAFGVSVSGAIDRISHRLANAAVGNRNDAATLEATWVGPELRVEQDAVLAVAGADLQARLDDADMPLQRAVSCRAGSVLRFGERRAGARAYVAFGGGIDVPLVLGSRATHVQSGLGGIGGRALRAGDRVPLREVSDPGQPARAVATKMPAGGIRLRAMPGPQFEYFAPSALDTLQRTRYTVSTDSDRMGFRLVGGAHVESVVGGGMLSDATFAGALQIPPSGDPILLMADRPTTGGYPQIVVVITADLSVAGQLSAGDWVEFELCSRADALSALVAQEGQILGATR
jgi:KipI family sensor histidine kinase inhibitor